MQQQMYQAQQNPNNPANYQHKDHMGWAKGLAGKLGQAAVFGSCLLALAGGRHTLTRYLGAGATAGSDLVNSIF